MKLCSIRAWTLNWSLGRSAPGQTDTLGWFRERRAIALTEELAPGTLEASPAILFRLHVQIFLELVRPSVSPHPDSWCSPCISKAQMLDSSLVHSPCSSLRPCMLRCCQTCWQALKRMHSTPKLVTTAVH